ncbi:amino acid transporter [archaeon SCG-AAA382B04]|nr:amino acid transporter [archaeon SCG-AAA382B04]
MSQEQGELARDLGFLEAYTLGLGTMIGAGIFVLPSVAAGSAGPASIISFIGGGLMSLLAALSLSEMATGMPKTGGSYYYVNHSLGPLFGSVAGWCMWIGLMFSSAFYMRGFGQYVANGNLGIVAAALIMAAILTGVNYYGVKETGGLQNIIVILLIGLIVLFISIGIFHVDISNLTPFVTNGWNNVATAIGTLYVSFIGFEVIASSAEEIKKPQKNLPLSMIAAVLTPTSLYALVMFVSIGVLGTQALAASTIPVADVASKFIGPIGGIAMIIGAIFATVSSANASILSASRINFAMGKDKILTNWLNQIHKKFQTPYRSILLTGIVILALIAIGVAIDTLAKVAGFAYLITYTLVHVSLIVMRRVDPEEYQPSFKIPLYPILPILGIVSSIAVLIMMDPLVIGIGSIIVIVGIAWYFVYARDKAPARGELKEAITPPTKKEAEEEKHKIIVPVANPETQRGLLKTANAIAMQHKPNVEIIALNVLEVPDQLSPQHAKVFEQERTENQQRLLLQAKDVIEDKEIDVTIKALISKNIADTIIDYVEKEKADELIIGWEGKLSPTDHIFGSKIDVMVKVSPCQISVVKVGPAKFQDIVALIGEGPNAPLAAKKAYQLHKYNPASRLTLLNVQEKDPNKQNQFEEGQRLIKEVAQKANIPLDEYKQNVEIEEEIQRTLLNEANQYDTVCLGGSRQTSLPRTLFGTIPEKIAHETEDTVLMTRKPIPQTWWNKLKRRIMIFLR